MYMLRFYLDENGKRVYTVKPVVNGKVTFSAHPYDRSNDTSFLHLHKSDNTKNLEDTHNYNNRDYKNTRSLTFEKLHRKNNYLKYKNIKDDHLLNNTNNEDKKQQENEENEYNNKNNLHSKNSFVMKVSYYLSYICSYIFSNKYHMLLPYYDDVSLTNEKKKKKTLNPSN
ncbi:hypothetical protein PFTANZ_05288 [Plasmodium falciparum Tanzania (2000708)]|uniref:Nucleolar protein 10 n=1 Tax=Plasmodium falciparum Tanzania (2000708) TaxID=1036725 RepID=A0A024VZZ1_PLAFA|nr:hypothetical protein PFTANZ_05288 [Plasmodium falciparum Tanzania (2000708)]